MGMLQLKHELTFHWCSNHPSQNVATIKIPTGGIQTSYREEEEEGGRTWCSLVFDFWVSWLKFNPEDSVSVRDSVCMPGWVSCRNKTRPAPEPSWEWTKGDRLGERRILQLGRETINYGGLSTHWFGWSQTSQQGHGLNTAYPPEISQFSPHWRYILWRWKPGWKHNPTATARGETSSGWSFHAWILVTSWGEGDTGTSSTHLPFFDVTYMTQQVGRWEEPMA